MWDQPCECWRGCRCARIIPTHVGSTSLSGTSMSLRANHSHACGINEASCSLSLGDSESFPRMWDQLSDNVTVPAVPRIIPTHVGSTRVRNYYNTYRPNHSHACGINYTMRDCKQWLGESFPRMWDQPTTATGCTSTSRIIPTHVGSTRYITGT